MKFIKMEGLGNDFIMVRAPDPAQFSKLVSNASHFCDRRKGIGADGIIFVMDSDKEEIDYRMRIFNSDGSEAEMCGNGIRCFSLYVREMNLSTKNSLAIETLAGVIHTTINDKNICVDMGKPILEANKIPTKKSSGQVIREAITVEDQEFHLTAISMGNPHAVIHTDKITDELVLYFGKRLSEHPFFPQKVNVEFIKVTAKDEIIMRVYERGCGETMACGTGACAAVVAGIINKLHDNKVTVHLRGGDLFITWDGNPDHSVFMTGPAKEVFHGECDLYDL